MNGSHGERKPQEERAQGAAPERADGAAAAARPWLGGELFWSAVFVIGLACVPTTFYGGSRTREAYVLRAEELFSDGAFSEAAAAYRRAVAVEETPDGHVFLAETLVRVKRLREAVAHYERAAALYDDPRERAAGFGVGGAIARRARFCGAGRVRLCARAEAGRQCHKTRCNTCCRRGGCSCFVSCAAASRRDPEARQGGGGPFTTGRG